MSIIQGLVGPKPRLKSVGDGHLANIPEPLANRYQLRGDQGGNAGVSTGRDSSSKLAGLGKSGPAFPSLRTWMHASCYEKLKPTGRGNSSYSTCQKTLVVRFVGDRTVNRHWWVGRKYQGVRVIPRKGIRHNFPVTSEQGDPDRFLIYRDAEKWLNRLFNKNTGPCLRRKPMYRG